MKPTTETRATAAALRAIYAAPISTRPHRNPPTMHSAGVNAQRAGNYLKRAAPDMTGEQHAAMAAHWAGRAVIASKLWGAIADAEMVRLFGRPMGFGDYRVSGIGRDEFSERIKTRLRILNRFATYASTLHRAHGRAAGVKRYSATMLVTFGAQLGYVNRLNF